MSRTTFELNDEGSIIAEYDPDTFELVGVENWHGGEVHDRWQVIAEEKLEEMKKAAAPKILGWACIHCHKVKVKFEDDSCPECIQLAADHYLEGDR